MRSRDDLFRLNPRSKSSLTHLAVEETRNSQLVAEALYGSGLRIMEAVRRESDQVSALIRFAIRCHPPAPARYRHPHDSGPAGHNDLATTMIYTHILQQGGHGCKSS